MSSEELPLGITSASRWKVPPPTQGAHGPGVRIKLGMGQSGSAGPWCRDTSTGPGPWQLDGRLHTQPSRTTRYVVAGTSQISPIGINMCLESQWFKIPSQWFPSRGKCCQEIAAASWQLHNSQEGLRQPGTCRPPVEDTYTSTTHFPVFIPFPHRPTSEVALGRQWLGTFWSDLPC